MFQDDCHLKIFKEFCYSMQLMFSAKTVAFVEITHQMFCSYALVFLSGLRKTCFFKKKQPTWFF